MQDAFDVFFDKNTAHKYNNILFANNADFIQITKIGLHNIYHKKIIKESHFHSHSFYEFHFSLSGCAVYQFADQITIRLEKGAWILIPVNCPHKIIEYSDRYIKYSCAFNLKDTESQSNEMNCMKEIFEGQEPQQGLITENVLTLIKQIYDKLSDPHPLAQISMKSLTNNIILEVATQISIEMVKYDLDSKNDTRLAIATEFIKDNIYNSITGEDVAKKVYLSLRQLDRIFLKYMSVSVSEFMCEQKIEEAKKLLVSTSLPVYEISDRLKFSDPAYFNRFFKKRVGKPPYQFRMDSKKGE